MKYFVLTVLLSLFPDIANNSEKRMKKNSNKSAGVVGGGGGGGNGKLQCYWVYHFDVYLAK